MRNLVVDALKGWAAFLVIVGHAIQRSFSGYLNNAAYNVIYSFHMPLFMLLSGYVLYFSKETINKEWIISKVPRLIIPFFIWYIIYWCFSDIDFIGLQQPFLDFSGSIPEYLVRGVIDPYNGPWFLWALFICYMMFYLSCKLAPKYGVFYSFLIVYILGRLLPFHGFGFIYIKTMFPFFAFGYMLAHYKNKIIKYRKCFLVSSLMIFPFLSISWYADFDLPQQLRAVISFLKIVIPLMGIILSYYLILIIKETKIFSTLVYLGTISLELYVCQNLFLNVGIGEGYFRMVTITFSALLLSILLMFFLYKVSFLKKNMFGK